MNSPTYWRGWLEWSVIAAATAILGVLISGAIAIPHGLRDYNDVVYRNVPPEPASMLERAADLALAVSLATSVLALSTCVIFGMLFFVTRELEAPSNPPSRF